MTARRLTLICDRLFDGAALRRGHWRLEVAGERIAALRPVDPRERPPHDAWDVRDATVLPGLCNAHVHIARAGLFGPSEPISLAQVQRNLEVTLRAGVTTVGDMGCAAPLVVGLRRRAAAEPGSGPAVLAAGPIVTAPLGYPLDWLSPRLASLGVVETCASSASAARAVERLSAAGVDHVKVAVMHESYGGKALPVMPTPVLAAVVSAAHAAGLRVLAHAHSAADYRAALHGGVDALMHSAFDPLDGQTLARVRDAGVPVCPTLWVFEAACRGAEARWDRDPRYGGVAPDWVRREWGAFCDAYAAAGAVMPAGIAAGLPKARAREAVRVAAANLLLLRDAGVPLGFGTDAAYGFCLHGRPQDELYAMHRAGLGAVECLRAATGGAAALLGRRDRGVLAPGARADLLVVDGDPTSDLAAIERVRAVVAAGRVVVGTGGRAATGPGTSDGPVARAARDLATRVAVARGLLATVAAGAKRALRVNAR
ncbi:MAG: amidohydrolase family protein [Deltaproteobacteria bacterium]|nr:amidohydrolase family protein [Deltaproteobacteria bacterium]